MPCFTKYAVKILCSCFGAYMGPDCCHFFVASVGQDLANHIRWSEQYKTETETHGVSPGKYLAAEVGKYFSGRQDVAPVSAGFQYSVSFAAAPSSLVSFSLLQAGLIARFTSWMDQA